MKAAAFLILTLVGLGLLHAFGPFALILYVVALILFYLGACLFKPLRDCGWCKGSPKFRGWFWRKTFSLCWWCGGSGYRKRWGRRIFDYWYRRMADAK